MADSDSITELNTLLSRINAMRASASADNSDCLQSLEKSIEEKYQPSHKFAVYGSLAPGGPNHEKIACIEGEWIEGYVRGELQNTGWGAEIGYPAIICRPRAPKIEVKLFVSDKLRNHWERLDKFEGSEYHRSLVSVHLKSGQITVANVYEARH